MSEPSLQHVLQVLADCTPEQREATLLWVKANQPEAYKKFVAYLKANKGIFIEAKGPEHWLKTLGAQTFTRPLAPIQKRFWEWNWNVLQKLRNGQALEPKELVAFLPHARETGKSSNIEWACIAEGALLRGGYVIFYSGKQAQAEEHVTAIRERIESEHVSEVYPWLGKPKMGAHGNKYGWGKEFLLTSGGWAIRPVGADVAIRGGKTLNLRPSLIVIDDLDELGDSPLVVDHKEQILTRSILPMGNDKTRVLVPQNPIHENSVVNRMLTGVSLALAIRTVFGEINEDGTMSQRPVPAVRDFAYEVRQTDEGPYSEITKGESNWPGISVTNWQTTLNRVGPPAFLSEYQHDMSIRQEDRVLPEYDDRVLRLHVVTWSQIEKLYGMRRVPSNWPCSVGLDIGYSDSHRSAWTFLAKVPEGQPLSGAIFRYRGRTFTGKSIDEQSVAIRKDLWPNEVFERQMMSHEKLGERITLSTKHQWFFQPCDSSKTAGIPQWRHFLQTDRSQPHPFHRDEKGVDGSWKLGRPAFFDIVADDQFFSPQDDYGLKNHRDSAYNWRMRKVKLTESGMTVEQPMKADDDEVDSCFIAGTKITTRYGENVIEQIKSDDVVLTRQGWRKVFAAGKTSSEAEVWELKLSNGNRLRGTRAHPIWVAGYGWKPLSEIKAGERLLSLTECDSTATQTQSIGHTGPTLSRTFTQYARELGRFMLNCGKRNMARFQKVMQSTIEIIIHSTMPTPTLNYLLVPNTAAITETICLPKSRRRCGQTLLASKSLQRCGIGVQRAESGTGSTPTKVSTLPQESKCSACTSFVKNFSKGVRGGASIVRRFVSSAIKMELSRLNVIVDTVVMSMKQGKLRANGHVLSAVSVQRLERKSPVYNLSVDGVPEYFANGVLVHNCRMLFSGSATFTEKPMTQAQRLQSLIPQGYRKSELQQQGDPNVAAMTGEFAEWLARRTMALKQPQVVDQWGQSTPR